MRCTRLPAHADGRKWRTRPEVDDERPVRPESPTVDVLTKILLVAVCLSKRHWRQNGYSYRLQTFSKNVIGQLALLHQLSSRSPLPSVSFKARLLLPLPNTLCFCLGLTESVADKWDRQGTGVTSHLRQLRKWTAYLVLTIQMSRCDISLTLTFVRLTCEAHSEQLQRNRLDRYQI